MSTPTEDRWVVVVAEPDDFIGERLVSVFGLFSSEDAEKFAIKVVSDGGYYAHTMVLNDPSNFLTEGEIHALELTPADIARRTQEERSEDDTTRGGGW